VRTRFATGVGDLSFQEFFVRERLEPKLRGISFAGIDSAHPTSEVLDALTEADLVVIGPSNPLISIAPILALIGKHLSRQKTIAVSPLVGGMALKGPTVEMMQALGPAPNPVEVARMYREMAASFVLDEQDRDLAPAITELGYKTIVCDTVMRDGGRTLARAVLAGL
jgi:LPPG:FO 2-phospho-L-lactate transferase